MDSGRRTSRLWGALRCDRRAHVGGALLGVIIVLAVAAPLLSGYDPLVTAPAQQLSPPGWLHLLGSDLFGRDVWSRLVWGGRLSLSSGVMATLIAVLCGSAIGLLSAYAGGRWDASLMRGVDMLLAFPSLLLALAIVAALGTGLTSAILAVGIAGIPRFARVMRAAALAVRTEPYIEAARVIGCRPARIVVRHLAPNVLDTLVVLASLELGYAVLNISALSFLGLGAQPPAAEWGLMLTEGRAYLRTAPWISAAPGVAITLSVLAINLVGDALRDGLGLEAQT